MTTDPTTGKRRPNLTAVGGRDEIERLLAIREPLYRECATIVVDSDVASPEELVEKIVGRKNWMDPQFIKSLEALL